MRRRASYASFVGIVGMGIVSGACSSSTAPESTVRGSGGSNTAGQSGSQNGSGGAGGIISTGGNGGGTAGLGEKLTETPTCDHTDSNVDNDGDGFTPPADCNDCTPQMNPGAYDYAGNGVDEDCNGTPDDEPANCDGNPLDIGYGDPMTAARVIGLCRMASGSSWGVVSAAYVLANGTPGMADLSHGLLRNFGPNIKPREGVNMLALSSGTARRPGDPGYQVPAGAQMGTSGPTPTGFPVPAPACPNQPQTAPIANDSAALEVVIRTPTNANAFKFDFDFYTFEFPMYICSQFNDFFVALVDPAPAKAMNGNVSFDSQGNPVSVNNGFLEVCKAQNAGGKNFGCGHGTSELLGTGYDDLNPDYGGPHAATGWLVTQAPVPHGQQIKIRFAIWDAGDEILDSSVLIDNMRWDIVEGDFPVTTPLPK